ncbi:Beta-lactamase enzyme family protein [Lentzea fradiae]|uniref:Beta-lactamase enzyme family protein n=1 Tax=Lentzea fradiae TaxID=200378 RepID=A0A1G7XHR4_9PSEU|nr:serine hydrolase [Lentzea fradiae]SDG83815.1 Beta-lactamase enzyme family protein [Lentzea fradiae]
MRDVAGFATQKLPTDMTTVPLRVRRRRNRWVIPSALVMVLLVVIVVAIRQIGAEDWRTGCTEFTPAPEEAPGLQDARTALLDVGHDPVLSMEILDLDTCVTALSWKNELAHPTASVVKLLIALDLLQRTPSNSEAVRNDVTAMLSRSDDAVASRLWQEAGGPAIVTRQAQALGLTHTRPPAAAGRWGSTMMSASDVSRVYRHIAGSLDAEDRALLTSAMGEAPRTAADGFDQHFGVPDGVPGATWAVKQGWGSADGRRVLHSTGFVKLGHVYAVTLLSSWRQDVDLAAASAALTKAAGAVRAAMS